MIKTPARSRFSCGFIALILALGLWPLKRAYSGPAQQDGLEEVTKPLPLEEVWLEPGEYPLYCRADYFQGTAGIAYRKIELRGILSERGRLRDYRLVSGGTLLAQGAISLIDRAGRYPLDALGELQIELGSTQYVWDSGRARVELFIVRPADMAYSQAHLDCILD